MPEKIKVGDRYIGENDPVFVIAEIGSNHNQDINIAKKLIDVAADTGADAAKFQLFDADEVYKPGDDLYEVFKEMQLDTDWLVELKTYTESKGLIFFASAFDEKSIHLLNDHGVSLYKWASSETTNLGDMRKVLVLSESSIPPTQDNSPSTLICCVTADCTFPDISVHAE